MVTPGSIKATNANPSKSHTYAPIFKWALMSSPALTSSHWFKCVKLLMCRISDQEFNPKVKLIGSPSVTAGLYLFNHHQFATCGNSVVASRNNSESFSTVAAAFEGFCLLLLCFLFSLLLLHSLTSFISCSHPTPTTSGFLSSPLPWSYLRLHFSD